MQAISKIIGFLSSQQSCNDKKWAKKPYPKEKLKKRFGDYQNLIKQNFVDLGNEYDQLLVQAKLIYIDEVSSGKIKAYLRQLSTTFLYDTKSDVRKALEDLIAHIMSKVDVAAHEGAVRFYILSELMECDIFPLTEEEEKILARGEII